MNQILDTQFDPIQEKKRLSLIARVADDPLMKLETVWPFQFFPSSIIIDRNKVTFIHGLFFFSKNVVSVLVKDIRTVNLTTGLLFSSIHLDIKGYDENPQQVSYLPKNEAIKAHRLIVGLIAAKAQAISIEELTNQDIYDKAIQIGTQQVKIDGVM